ncbi:ABC transporter permease [bacterium]|nr:ABC transporter permease [bacterium]
MQPENVQDDSPDLIRLENIVKTYQVGEVDVPVLKGVSFSIKRGELVALMGASGSGKSTLMNILGCLDRPTSGHYWLDGREVGGLSPDERALVRTAKLGFVFQSFNLLPRTTAMNNVLMPLDYSPAPPTAGKSVERAYELLVRVGLEERLDHVPSKMSGGQQQRVAIARSLINQPALLLADEPTGNLDSKTSVEILRMFQELNAAGITVVLVTHDPKVASYAHRTIRVKDGLIEEDVWNNDRELLSSPTNGHHLPAASPSLYSNGNGANGHGMNLLESVHESGSAVATLEAPAAALVAETETKITASKPITKNKTPVRASFLVSVMPTTLRTAMNALRRNKMRSALTTLGIIIGVAAVIAMVEISQGSKAYLMKTMSTMGANNLLVQSGAASSGGINFGSGSEKTLTPSDAEEIGKQCMGIAAVAPVVQISGQVVHGNRNWIPMSIYGTTPDYLIVRDFNGMEEGEMFTDQDVRAGIKVCVIGATLVRELFDGASPIGKDIRIQNVSLRVVGVLARKGANMMGMDQDDLVIAPWTTIKFRVSGSNSGGASRGSTTASALSGAVSTKINSLNNLYPGGNTLFPQKSESQAANYPQPVRFTHVDQILCKASSAEEIPLAMSQITELLHERHHIREGKNNDFNIRDMSEMLKALTSMTTMMGALLLIVAFISLAVGGVGIMNIMLVSVTERTREIGLRMAVGARGFQILRQFLVESIVLCLFGGAAGIALGQFVAFAVWFFLRWPIEASYPAVFAAFGVSATIGITFGFYPAWKASRLDPIDALRYE